MKILSWKIEDGLIKVLTNNKDRINFVYPVDKFDSFDKMKKEINKSISLEEKRKDKRNAKIAKLDKEFQEAKDAGY